MTTNEWSFTPTPLHAKVACREKNVPFAFGHTDIEIYVCGTEHSNETGDYFMNKHCVSK
jgi:hypothetical protein